MASLLDQPAVERALTGARLAEVAVGTARGPFVTPVLYGVAYDRVWFLIRRDTLKSRALRRDARVGLLVRHDDTDVVLAGTAALLPSNHPWEWLRFPTELAAAPAGAFSWALRNPVQLAGFVRDALPALTTCLPQDFVAVALRPTRLAVVTRGRLGEAHGDWPVVADPAPAGPYADLPELPHQLDALVRRSGPVAVGVQTSAGPLVVPGSWRPGTKEVHVPVGLVGTSAPTPVAVTFADTLRVRPSAQRGVMLRGSATPSRTGLRIHTQRVTYWDGFATGTLELDAAAAPAVG